MPLDTVNDIRSMDAAGRSRSEIARMLHVSRNTVAKYADMEDMSPAAPMPRRRGGPALEGNGEWVAGVLEADLGAPRKQRYTTRRIYDRLVAERGYGGLDRQHLSGRFREGQPCLREEARGALLLGILPRHAPAPRPRRREARSRGRAHRAGPTSRDRRARLPAPRYRRGEAALPGVRRRV